MKNLTIRMQLGLAFSLLVLFFVSISTLSLRNLSIENDNFEIYVTGIMARANAAHRVREAIDQRAISARNLMIVTRTEDVEMEKEYILKAQADVVENMKSLKKLAKDDSASNEVRRVIDKIDSIENAYFPISLEIVNLALAKKYEQASIKMNEECRPLLIALVNATDEYFQMTEQRSTHLVQEAKNNYIYSRNILICTSLLVIVLAILEGFLIANSLLKSLGTEPLDLCNEVRCVASGDLTGKLNVSSNDTSSILANLQEMKQSLIKVVSAVRQNSEMVSTAASEISSGNNDLSARTEQQLNFLEETASSMEELTSTVKQNAENARQANVLASMASDVAGKGGIVVAQVVGTMDLISESSRKIVEIISVIDSIAFQTNILALNAAVEAARAGEQGRGFAVVASEVRSLAHRSASAAKEIKQLIDDSVERVSLGSKLAAQAGSTMSDVVSSVKRVSDIIAEITVASQEQSVGIEQVSQAILEMDNVAQQNASLVEEAAAAADSLRDQAAHLVNTVSTFKTENIHCVISQPLFARENSLRFPFSASSNNSPVKVISKNSPSAGLIR